ncbi:DNA-binding response regulator [Bryobacterales bacterium F-183]|nr:DNA-binding response regulator [Bryobacterales bacterium F-183]
MNERILVVEDEKHLADGLRFNLEVEGYTVEMTETGEEALQRITNTEAEPVALVLLDVMLPGIDGFSVVRRMRELGVYVPVLMLTARGRSEDIIKGFESGADDYLPKPFELEIVFARVRGLLRRTAWAATVNAPKNQVLNRLELGDRVIDFDRMELSEPDGQRHQLTLMETNLLRFLAERDGQTVSRSQLLEGVWGVREDTDTRAIDNFIVRLRRYIEPDPAHPRFLTTIRGVGYRFQQKPTD